MKRLTCDTPTYAAILILLRATIEICFASDRMLDRCHRQNMRFRPKLTVIKRSNKPRSNLQVSTNGVECAYRSSCWVWFGGRFGPPAIGPPISLSWMLRRSRRLETFFPLAPFRIPLLFGVGWPLLVVYVPIPYMVALHKAADCQFLASSDGEFYLLHSRCTSMSLPVSILLRSSGSGQWKKAKGREIEDRGA